VHAPADGRAFISATLTDRLGGRASAVLDDCQLMASELLTNAVKAGARTVTIGLSLDLTVLRLEVSDDGGGMPTPRNPTEHDTNGRGLLIVASLAERWSIDVQAGHKTCVWAELTVR
jgi:anti-sigma regulatory factor (Ser/Thr protein kinase)